MGRNAMNQIDSRIAGAVTSLHTFLDAEPDAADFAAGITARCGTRGGEALFCLPAEHPSLGESRWTVLRFVEGSEERFVHVFLAADGHGHWIGEEGDAPAEFASFARTWTDVLTRCAGGMAARLAS